MPLFKRIPHREEDITVGVKVRSRLGTVTYVYFEVPPCQKHKNL